MGVSTNGQLAYGYIFEEGYEFPWTDQRFDDDPENWWMEFCKWSPSVSSPYTLNGDYKEGIDSDHPDVEIYFRERREWKENNPLPFELVNYQSCDSPAYMLAVLGTLVEARRGFPTSVNPDLLVVSPENASALATFISEHDLTDGLEGSAGWYLTSIWC